MLYYKFVTKFDLGTHVNTDILEVDIVTVCICVVSFNFTGSVSERRYLFLPVMVMCANLNVRIFSEIKSAGDSRSISQYRREISSVPAVKNGQRQQ